MVYDERQRNYSDRKGYQPHSKFMTEKSHGPYDRFTSHMTTREKRYSTEDIKFSHNTSKTFEPNYSEPYKKQNVCNDHRRTLFEEDTKERSHSKIPLRITIPNELHRNNGTEIDHKSYTSSNEGYLHNKRRKRSSTRSLHRSITPQRKTLTPNRGSPRNDSTYTSKDYVTFSQHLMYDKRKRNSGHRSSSKNTKPPITSYELPKEIRYKWEKHTKKNSKGCSPKDTTPLRNQNKYIESQEHISSDCFLDRSLVANMPYYEGNSSRKRLQRSNTPLRNSFKPTKESPRNNSTSTDDHSYKSFGRDVLNNKRRKRSRSWSIPSKIRNISKDFNDGYIDNKGMLNFKREHARSMSLARSTLSETTSCADSVENKSNELYENISSSSSKNDSHRKSNTRYRKYSISSRRSSSAEKFDSLQKPFNTKKVSIDNDISILKERNVRFGPIGESILMLFISKSQERIKISEIYERLPFDCIEELEKIYKSDDALLKFLEEETSHVFQVQNDWVSFEPTLTICGRFSKNKGKCSLSQCRNLHICMIFALSNFCPYENCRYGHDLTSVHNTLILAFHFMSDLCLFSKLRNIIFHPQRRPPYLKPKICKFYNWNGCKNDNCISIHICNYFIQNKCKFDPCKRSHSLKTEHHIEILKKFGLTDFYKISSDINLSHITISKHIDEKNCYLSRIKTFTS